MLNQIAETKAQDAALPDHSQIIKRYEMNYQKLQQISDKIGADIDFSEMKNLLTLAKRTINKVKVIKQNKLLIKLL